MTYKIEHDGKTIELPDFKNIPVGVIRKARFESEQNQSWFILEQTLSAEDLEILDSLSVAEFAKHINKWTGGMSLGES